MVQFRPPGFFDRGRSVDKPVEPAPGDGIQPGADCPDLDPACAGRERQCFHIRSHGSEVDEKVGGVKSLAVQQPCGILREIGQDPVAAGALEGHQAFHHRAFPVDPAVLRGPRDHRVFA